MHKAQVGIALMDWDTFHPVVRHQGHHIDNLAPDKWEGCMVDGVAA